jgi:hypothetical protein
MLILQVKNQKITFCQFGRRGTTRDIVANFADIGRTTLQKAEKIVEAAEQVLQY